MKLYLIPLVAAVALLAGCDDDTSKKTAANATNAPAKYDTGNPLTAPADYVGAVVQAKKYSEKVIDVSYLNQAIQQYNAMEGHLPKTLNDLVPNYVGKLPAPPYGMKLDYDATAGTVKVVQK